MLAYSGGLDTSIIIPWLKEHYNNPEIIAVSGDVGQNDELEGLEEKAIKTGASKLYIADLTDEMVDEVIIPSMKMGASYEQYLLGTAFARPIIAKKLVEIAKAEGADAIAHGCTGKGNDQVRFELAIKRFAPDMTIIAPWREWDIKGRDEEIDYAEAHNVPLKITRETNYSKDKNLWHLSHEGLDLEDPANEPQYEKPGFLEMGVSPIAAPDKPTYVTIDFEKGVPVAVDGEKMKASDVIRKLNKLGGENGIGLLDIVENRLVGMKDRGVYETPGGTILYTSPYFLGQFYQIYFLFLRLWRGYVLYSFFAHNSNYLKRLTIVAIIAAIEAVVLPIPRISAVVIFFFCSLLGTIISQPGSMAFLFPAFKRETVPFMYIT